MAIDSFIDGHTGPISIRAAGNVDINQPIVNLASGTALDVAAGSDINVNAQVDGRGGVEGGAVTMTASRDLNVNQAIVANNGAVSLTATNGAMNVASGAPMVSGTGAIALNARGDISTGPMSAGSLAVTSTAGSVAVNGLIDAATGDTRISAASDVNDQRGHRERAERESAQRSTPAATSTSTRDRRPRRRGRGRGRAERRPQPERERIRR